MFLMWGYEGEDLADIEATVEHVQACRPDVFLTTVSYPIKGTPYYEEVASKLVHAGDWQCHHGPRRPNPRPPLAPLLPVGRSSSSAAVPR